MYKCVTLKNVLNPYEFENARKANARKVLNPPLKTAGPILEIASAALSVKLENDISIRN